MITTIQRPVISSVFAAKCIIYPRLTKGRSPANRRVAPESNKERFPDRPLQDLFKVLLRNILTLSDIFTMPLRLLSITGDIENCLDCKQPISQQSRLA